MKKVLHAWNLTEAQAVALQRELAGRIDTATPLAGADVSNNPYSDTVYAGVVVLRAADWVVVERKGAVGRAGMAYVPGLLSFREAPVLLEAFGRLEHRPDVAVLDGQGIAHPRRLGIAAHVGLWLDLPTVGCAKSKLCGSHADLGDEPGATAPLVHRGERVGTVLKSKKRANPLFISPGHRIDFEGAERVVRSALRGYRLPEPTRLAHEYVNALRRGELAPSD